MFRDIYCIMHVWKIASIYALCFSTKQVKDLNLLYIQLIKIFGVVTWSADDVTLTV